MTEPAPERRSVDDLIQAAVKEACPGTLLMPGALIVAERITADSERPSLVVLTTEGVTPWAALGMAEWAARTTSTWGEDETTEGDTQ